MPSSNRRSSPVLTRRADPAVWQAALVLADGDPGRLTLLQDGTVLVANRGRRRE